MPNDKLITKNVQAYSILVDYTSQIAERVQGILPYILKLTHEGALLDDLQREQDLVKRLTTKLFYLRQLKDTIHGLPVDDDSRLENTLHLALSVAIQEMISKTDKQYVFAMVDYAQEVTHRLIIALGFSTKTTICQQVNTTIKAVNSRYTASR